jgi:hypothetical protein
LESVLIIRRRRRAVSQRDLAFNLPSHQLTNSPNLSVRKARLAHVA